MGERLPCATRHWQLAACALPMLMACGDPGDSLPEHEIGGSIMGTSYTLRVVDPPSGFDASITRNDAAELLAAINRTMSTYDPDSVLSAFNQSRSTDWIETSPLLCGVVADAQNLSRLTGGAFDITVGPLVNLWGFGPGPLVTEPPPDALLERTRERVGYDKLETDCGRPGLRKAVAELYVDLSAYAKGYAVDRVAELLEASGVSNYLVEIGGEMRVRGRNARGEAWAIAIEKPLPGSRAVQSIVALTDAALATSGDYRNFFEHEGTRYSHTIDPRTGRPVDHAVSSVTVVAEQAARADALATALLVLGPDEGIAFAEREHIAALFLQRSGDRIEERMTARFIEEFGQ